MSNISEAGKEDVIGWGMPDYSAAVSKTTGTTHTAEVDGFIRACNFSNGGSSYTINDVTRLWQGGNSSSIYVRASMFVPVNKGDTYSITVASDYFEFIPLKGASINDN